MANDPSAAFVKFTMLPVSIRLFPSCHRRGEAFYYRTQNCRTRLTLNI